MQKTVVLPILENFVEDVHFAAIDSIVVANSNVILLPMVIVIFIVHVEIE